MHSPPINNPDLCRLASTPCIIIVLGCVVQCTPGPRRRTTGGGTCGSRPAPWPASSWTRMSWTSGGCCHAAVHAVHALLLPLLSALAWFLRPLHCAVLTPVPLHAAACAPHVAAAAAALWSSWSRCRRRGPSPTPWSSCAASSAAAAPAGAGVPWRSCWTCSRLRWMSRQGWDAPAGMLPCGACFAGQLPAVLPMKHSSGAASR